MSHISIVATFDLCWILNINVLKEYLQCCSITRDVKEVQRVLPTGIFFSHVVLTYTVNCKPYLFTFFYWFFCRWKNNVLQNKKADNKKKQTTEALNNEFGTAYFKGVCRQEGCDMIDRNSPVNFCTKQMSSQFSEIWKKRVFQLTALVLVDYQSALVHDARFQK